MRLLWLLSLRLAATRADACAAIETGVELVLAPAVGQELRWVLPRHARPPWRLPQHAPLV